MADCFRRCVAAGRSTFDRGDPIDLSPSPIDPRAILETVSEIRNGRPGDFNKTIGMTFNPLERQSRTRILRVRARPPFTFLDHAVHVMVRVRVRRKIVKISQLPRIRQSVLITVQVGRVARIFGGFREQGFEFISNRSDVSFWSAIENFGYGAPSESPCAWMATNGTETKRREAIQPAELVFMSPA